MKSINSKSWIRINSLRRAWALYKKATGLSLLELTVVMAVISILAALTVAAVTGSRSGSKEAVLVNDEGESTKASATFAGVHPKGFYPVTLQSGKQRVFLLPADLAKTFDIGDGVAPVEVYEIDWNSCDDGSPSGSCPNPNPAKKFSPRYVKKPFHADDPPLIDLDGDGVPDIRVWIIVKSTGDARVLVPANTYGTAQVELVQSTPTPAPTATPAPATLEIRATDAPPPGVSRFLVTISNIQINKSSSETEVAWLTVVPGSRTFDLVAVTGIEEVLGSIQVEAARYNQVRFEVVNALITLEGVDRPVLVTPGKHRFIGGFDLAPFTTTVLTLDFDGTRSIILPVAAEPPILAPAGQLLVRPSDQPLPAATTVTQVLVAPPPTPVPTPLPTATPTPVPTPTPSVATAPTLIATVSVPASPRLIAVNSVTNRAYVAVGDGFTSSTHFVSVIDGTTNTANIAVPDSSTGPIYIAVNEATNRVYVSHTGAYYGSAINASTNTVIGNVTTGAYPEGIVTNPSTNRLYIANTNSSSVSVINTTDDTNSVLQTIPISVSTTSNLYLAIIPATNRIFVTAPAVKQVKIIDVGTNTVVQSIQLSVAPRLIAANPTTNRLYMTLDDTAGILVMDAANGSTIATIPVGTGPTRGVAVNPTTNRIYVTNSGSNMLTIIDGATNSVSSTVNLPTTAENLAVDTSNGRVYVTSTNSVMVLQDATFTPTPTPTPVPTPTPTPLPTPTPTPVPAFTLQSQTFFGGQGNQSGTGVAVGGGYTYLSGVSDSNGGANGEEGLVAKYTLSPSTQVWSVIWPLVSGPDRFGGVALSTDAVYVAGNSYSQTSDGAGGKEVKGVLLKYNLSGGRQWVAAPNIFAYRGTEDFSSVATSVEGASTFLYATGSGEPCSYGKFFLVKFNTAGTLVNKATEPGNEPNFSSSCAVFQTGWSHGYGLTTLNGNIYVAGTSNLIGLGEDSTGRPVLMKYDSSLSRVWKQRPADIAGQFRAVAAVGNNLYAVGHTWTSEANGGDYLIQKYDEAGNLAWSKVFGGAGEDALTGVVGVGGRLFAVGYTQSEGSGGADAVVMEIDPATGNVLYKTLFGGANDDMANGVATDGGTSLGVALYVVGASNSFATGLNAVGSNDVILLRYSLQ